TSVPGHDPTPLATTMSVVNTAAPTLLPSGPRIDPGAPVCPEQDRYENAGAASETTTKMRGRRARPLRKCGGGERDHYENAGAASETATKMRSVHVPAHGRI